MGVVCGKKKRSCYGSVQPDTFCCEFLMKCPLDLSELCMMSTSPTGHSSTTSCFANGHFKSIIYFMSTNMYNFTRHYIGKGNTIVSLNSCTTTFCNRNFRTKIKLNETILTVDMAFECHFLDFFFLSFFCS